MANFYISPVRENLSDPEIIYELHATTQVRVGFSSTVTNYPTETGSVLSDNVVMNPDTVSFTGILTDVSQTAGFSPISIFEDFVRGDNDAVPRKLETYIEDIRMLQFEKEVFKVYFSGDNDGIIANIEFAILTQFDLNKDPTLGQSWSVTVALQEIRFAQQAQLVGVPAEAFAVLNAQNTKDKGNGSELDGNQNCQVLEGDNLDGLQNSGQNFTVGFSGSFDCP